MPFYECQTSTNGRLVPATYHTQEDTPEIIVRLSHLQETLATGYILKERRRIPPDTICRAHIYRSIKLPTGPGSLSGRISCAVK